MISGDGRITSELNRRIGMASADFATLSRIWNHSNLTRLDKVEIYQVLILSKLLYGLETTWLSAVERRKLDGFHCRCLRRFAGIRPAYWSRITNKGVLDRFAAQSLSSLLLQRQLNYLGKLARLPSTSSLRALVFQPNSVLLSKSSASRRRGRPRLNWNTEVYRHALMVCENQYQLENVIMDGCRWKTMVREYCRLLR